MNKPLQFFTVIFIIFTTIFLRFPAGVKFYGYGVIRELMKAHVVIGAWGMEKITSEHFCIRFWPEARAEAELVLEVAEQFYHPVTGDFFYSPRGRIPLILYSSREELNKCFGWEAKESAMGVYWGGTIRVLSPQVWIGDTDAGRVREKFISCGPVVHELTHLMVDYLTGGNYPRWFTEGVAQYEDYKITGFMISESVESTIQPMYSLKELAVNFDGLPDQTLAYKQSFAAVYYIVETYGEGALQALIKELGKGKDLSRAMENVLQINLRQFEKEWLEKNNGDRNYIY